MGVKISNLPSFQLPYTGRELVPFVQNGETRVSVLSTLNSYLSSALVADSELAALSTNFALKNANNNFTAEQTIAGGLTGQYFTLSGGQNNTGISFRAGNGSNTFGITNVTTVSGNSSICLGYNVLSAVSQPSEFTNNVVIGTDAGVGAGSNKGIIRDAIIIGTQAGDASTTPPIAERNGSVADIIALGKNVGAGMGSIGGSAEYVVALGAFSCNNAGLSGTITNIISIGSSSCGNIGLSSGVVDEIVSIGSSSGANIGSNGGTAQNIVNIGFNSGTGTGSYNGFADKCISIGHNAGNELASLNGTVQSTIFIGADSGYYAGNATGSVNNAIGIGTHSGEELGNGGYTLDSILIGNYAGLQTGSLGGDARYIIGIGTNAGQSIGKNLGVVDNVIAIGNNAGLRIGQDFTANDIIAIGNTAGNDIGANASAQYVIAIGAEAGNNVGLGGNEIYNNIFIGTNSGASSNGSYNTFVGCYTNTFTDSVNISGCIALGYNAKPSVSNTIAIGSGTRPLSVVPGGTLGTSLSGLRIMVNDVYYTLPLLA